MRKESSSCLSHTILMTISFSKWEVFQLKIKYTLFHTKNYITVNLRGTSWLYEQALLWHYIPQSLFRVHKLHGALQRLKSNFKFSFKTLNGRKFYFLNGLVASTSTISSLLCFLMMKGHEKFSRNSPSSVIKFTEGSN